MHDHCWLGIKFSLFSIGIILTVLASQVNAQQYHFVQYNVEHGLAQSEVYSICQDSRGYLWFGTAGGGVSRFDGTDFRNFTMDDGLRNSEVSDILETKEGQLYFLGMGSLTIFDGYAWRSYGENDGLDFQADAHMFVSPTGDLWIASQNNGVFLKQGDSFIRFGMDQGLPSDTVFQIHFEPSGEILAATTGGIRKFVDGRFEAIDSTFISNAPSWQVRWITRSPDGTLWVTGRNGAWTLEGDSLKRVQAIDGVGVVRSLFFDSEGRIWVSGSHKLGRMDGDKFTALDRRNGMREIGIYRVIEDRSGNIWIGTEGAGVFKYGGDVFVHYGDGTAIEQRAVFSIVEMEKGKYIVGTERGLFDFVDHKFTLREDMPGEETFIFDIAKDNEGNLYIASREGAFRFDGEKYTKIGGNDDFRYANVTGVARDSKGDIWMANAAGFFKVKGDSTEDLKLKYPELDVRGTDIFEDSRGTVWMVSSEEGIRMFSDGKITVFDEDDGLPNQRTLNVREDKNGNIWVGTYSGLARYNGTDFCYLGHREGLNADIIYFLQMDKDGNLWAGTERGLNRIRLDDKSEPLDIRTYSNAEGFVGVECNQGASYEDSDGTLWFGTIEGLTAYFPDADEFDTEEPLIQLTAFKIHLEEKDWSKSQFETEPWSNLPIDPVLEAHDNHIRIEFKAVTQRIPHKVRYKYKLEGAESGWSPASHETQATFSNLSPGNYIFHVRAANSDGVWTKNPTSFAFSIRVPFYQTWWFPLIILGGIFIVTYIVVKIRINRLQRARSILESKVKKRTEELEQATKVKSEFLAKMSHEIRTPMNGVIGMTDLLTRTPLDDQQKKFVDNIRTSGQNLLLIINDILDFSRIESGKIELESVPLDLRSLIEEVLEILAYGAYLKGLELIYYVDPEIRGPIMGDPSRIKQVLVNLVGNAIKFTSKGRISVRADLIEKTKVDAHIRLSVKDSGIGIPKGKFDTLFESFTQVDLSTTRKYGGTGLGLAISFQLSKLMGGKMWVESEYGEGSNFIFTIRAGLSAPWHVKGEDHPATDLIGRKVAMSISDPQLRQTLERYLSHWQLKCEIYESLEELMDGLLDHADMDFILVDSRRFKLHHEKAAQQMAEICAEKQMHYALLCEPELAIELNETLNEFGWIISKPLNRDDFLNALLLRRTPFRPKTVVEVEVEEELAKKIPLKILIAEDNPINMDVAEGMLRRLGYAPEGAENGLIVLDKIANKSFDLVFMDVQMPEMDGLEATRKIVKTYAKADRPVIVAMTANAMESDRQRCLNAGMDTFISKPFLLTELVELIREIADLRGTNPEGRQNGIELETQEEEVETEIAVPAPVVATEEEQEKESVAAKVESENKPEVAEPRITDLGMLEEASGGDKAFMAGILGKLVLKLPEAVLELKEAAEKEDWENVRKTAHRTKSSAAYAGSNELKEMFRELEHMAREKEDLEQVSERVDSLGNFVTQVVAELEEHLKVM